MSMNVNSSVQNFYVVHHAQFHYSTLNMYLSKLICINAITFQTVLHIETMFLVQGLFTGSNVVFEIFQAC
jgi:hypothetical protein